MGAVIGMTLLPPEAQAADKPVSMGVRVATGPAVALLAAFFALLLACLCWRRPRVAI